MVDQTPENPLGVDTPPPETDATVQQSEGENAIENGLTDAVNEIASKSRILDCFYKALKACGVVGEEKVAKICYLALTSRVLERPVSVAVKGPSSGGKSYVTGQVLRFFPESAYYALSAMSDKALVYSNEDLRHRFLVLFEAESLKGDTVSYFIRSLLSEGRIRYETVESSNAGIVPRLIEREGPTGLLITTTATSLHSENETRYLSLTVQDTPEQTKAILRSIAAGGTSEEEQSDWIALQEWLGRANHRVVNPFALTLAELFPPNSVRLRRDFGLLLNLIKAHAILHQLSREQNADGEIIATLDDYAVVRDLVVAPISEGLGATVSKEVRETVNVLGNLNPRVDTDTGFMSLADVAKKLGIDKSSASRRVKQAIKLGYLMNAETIRGKPMQLYIGDPLPEEVQVLPRPEQLQIKGEKDVAAVWDLDN